MSFASLVVYNNILWKHGIIAIIRAQLYRKHINKLRPCKNGTGILAGSCQDPGKIPAGIPPRFWPPGIPPPAKNPGKIPAGIPPRFWPPGFLPGFLAGGGIPSGQNLGRIPAGILPGFLAGGGIPGGIRAGILPGFLAGGGIPGGQNLGGIPAGILPGFLAGGGIPGGQNLGGIPAGVLPGFLAGNRISRWECCRDSRRETKPLAVKILLRSGRKAKFPSAKISGGPVWNLARIRDENVININQTTRR